MEKTILTVMRGETDPDSIPSRLGQQVFGGRYDDPEHIKSVFSAHIAEVQAAFGRDRLLTYELGSGWEPLCDFLGVPVPDAPYPTGNQSDQFHEKRLAGDAERIAKGGI